MTNKDLAEKIWNVCGKPEWRLQAISDVLDAHAPPCSTHEATLTLTLERVKRLEEVVGAVVRLAETTMRLNEGAPESTTRMHASAVNRALIDIAGIGGAALRPEGT